MRAASPFARTSGARSAITGDGKLAAESSGGGECFAQQKIQG